MRKKIVQVHVGDYRIHKKFPVIPMELGGEYIFAETVYVVQRYNWQYMEGSHWVDMREATQKEIDAFGVGVVVSKFVWQEHFPDTDV